MAGGPGIGKEIGFPIPGTSQDKKQAVIKLVQKKQEFTEKLRDEHKNKYSRHLTPTRKTTLQPQMEFINKVTNSHL